MQSETIVAAILVGLGATLFGDVVTTLLKLLAGMTFGNFCLVGRWFLHMPRGQFRHADIAAAPAMPGECAAGWIAHYAIGAIYGLAFIALAGERWLESPTWLPALAFGIGSIVMPFFVMQPAFGLGMAASKTPSPWQSRFRSLVAHTSFGIGLYVSGLALRALP